MATMASQGVDCWLTRTNKMANVLNIPQLNYSAGSGCLVLKTVRGCFDRYWLDEVKSTRTGVDNEQHNKLLTYSSFKASFRTLYHTCTKSQPTLWFDKVACVRPPARCGDTAVQTPPCTEVTAVLSLLSSCTSTRRSSCQASGWRVSLSDQLRCWPGLPASIVPKYCE